MRVDLDTSPSPLSGRDGPRRIPGGVIRPGTWLHLLRALNDLAGGAGELRDHAERAWASATFTGSRHAFTIDFTGLAAIDGAEDLIARLPDHEFAIPGQIVADATILAVEHRALPVPGLTLTCELLLVAEA